MTTRKLMPLVLAASALAIVGCKPQTKDGAPADAPPVATVNGKPISAAAFQVWVTAQTNKKVEELTPEQKKDLLRASKGSTSAVRKPRSRTSPPTRRSPLASSSTA